MSGLEEEMALSPREHETDRGSPLLPRADSPTTRPSGAAKHRARQVAALTHMLGMLDATAAPGDVARLFARELRTFIEADAVTVYSFDVENDRRVRVAHDADDRVTPPRERSSLLNSSSYHGVAADATATYDRDERTGNTAWLQHVCERTGLGSAVAARLDGANGAVGVIVAGTIAAAWPAPSKLDVLIEVARPLAIVLERARLVESLRQQAARTQSVVDILAAVGPRESFAEIARPVATSLRNMFSADHCAIGLIAGDSLVIFGRDSGLKDAARDAHPLARIRGFQETAGKGYSATADLGAPGAATGDTADGLRATGLRSLIRATFGPPDCPIGLVLLGSSAAHHFAEADARQLFQVVQPLGVAARYFGVIQEAERRAARIEHANRIIAGLTAGSSQQELASGFLKGCLELFDAELGAVALQPPGGDISQVAVQTAIPELSEYQWPSYPGAAYGIAGHGDAPERVLRIDDFRASIPMGPVHTLLDGYELRSGLRAPLAAGDSRGVVSLLGRGVGHFSADDAELLSSLCAPLALALEKRAAVESLAENERKYHAVVAQADEIIFLVDPESLAIVEANPFTATTLGYEPDEIVGLPLTDIVDMDPADIARNANLTVKIGALHLSDRRYRRKDGTSFDADVVASIIAYGGRDVVLVMARDVSERKALQHQAIQSQKMESLGTMAGYVAHDFNNLLTTILGFSGLIKRSTGLGEEDRDNLRLIEDAARRAAELTRRLLTFARGGLVSFGTTDLRDVVTETLALCQPGVHPNMHVTSKLPTEPVLIEGDSGQLQQAVMNVLLNACDALEASGNVDVTLARTGGQAVLTIADDGPGMPEEVRARIFEPFFSTKPIGSGTGLGLAITYGIVQAHHGTITVRSAPGEGTRFTIALPTVIAHASTDAAEIRAG